MLEHGAKVLVRAVCFEEYEEATIVDHYVRDREVWDATGRFVLSPAGVVYQVRYKPNGGLYNVHESRVVPSLVGVCG